MSSINPEVLLLKSTGLTERFNAALQHLTAEALKELLKTKVGSVSEIGKSWREAALALVDASTDTLISHRAAAGAPISLSLLKASLTLESLKASAHIAQDSAIRYLELLPRCKQSGEVSEAGFGFHDYTQHYLLSILDELVEDMKLDHSDPGMYQVNRVGDVLLEGNGFEVKTSKSLASYVEYSEGNTAIMVIHDVREGQFLLVERYNPVEGVFMLEFPRAPGRGEVNQEAHVSATLRDLTGLPLRDLENIGQLNPDSHLIKGVCEVYYGNFDLEENHSPRTAAVRSLKRITEEGLYQAAYERRITCALTMSAISVWHAFESVRKKRVQNSKRVRNPARPSADEPEAEADEE